MTLLSRDFFQLQIDYVEALVSKHGVERNQAYFDNTCFYVRCIGHSDETLPDSNHPKWQQLVSQLTSNPVQVTNLVYQAYLDFENAKPVGDPPTACFHTFYHQSSNQYELHFDPIDPQGNLGKDRQKVRHAELKTMFEHIAGSKHRDATLYGRTWLLNIPAFTRLFPPQFGEEAAFWQSGNRQYDNSHWGQFIDRHKQLKTGLVNQFKENLTTQTHQDFNFYFPLPVKYSELPVEVFLTFYGVS